jgi:hypothetical protein
MSFLRCLKKFSSQQTHGRPRHRGRARLFLEPLETRVTPTVTLHNGVLTVTGDDTPSNNVDDLITLDLNFVGGVSATVNGHSFLFFPFQVSSIVVDPGLGHNRVRTNALPGGVPLTVNCAGNEDAVSLGFSTNNLDRVPGPVTVHGDGSTQIFLDDGFSPNPIGATYVITAGFVARAGFGGVTYSGIGLLTLSGEMASTYDVVSTSCQIQVTPQDGPRPNTFNIGTGNLDAIQGTVVVLFSSAPDLVVLHDETCTTSQTYTISGGDISRGTSDVLLQEGLGPPFAPVTINAGVGNDTFDVLAGITAPLGFTSALAFPLTINGGGGHNTVEFTDLFSQSFEVTSSTVLTDLGAPFTYSAVQNLVLVEAFADTSIMSTAAGGNVTIHGALTVTVGTSLDGLDDIKGGISVFGIVDRSGSRTILTLDDAASTLAGTGYQVSSTSVFRLPGLHQISYSDLANLILDAGSGSNDSVLVLDTPATMATTINAGHGADNVQLSGSFIGTLNDIKGPLTINGGGNTTATLFDQSTTNPETYTLISTPTGASLTQSGGFSLTTSNLASLVLNAGSGGNQFVVAAAPGATALTLNGGSGTNTLTGPDATPATTTWAITGAGSGTIDTEVSFNGMTSLTGGAGNDVFEFSAGGSIAGTIDGGGGTNQLNYSPEAGPITVNLQTRTAPQILGGAAGSYSNIESFAGSASTADTLIGPDADTNWVISSPGGGTAGSFTFAGFENLVGGSGVDVFQFTGVGSLKGKLDGGAAPLHEGNWLDYSGLIGAITVNLKTGSAAGVAGGVVNVQNVHGGDAGNTLTGNSQGNILIGGSGSDHITGGTGRSLLIGDLGADTITGGSGGDILIGDATSFDTMTTANEKALMSILAEWQSADSYATRFTDIDTGTGTGLNGPAKLNFGTTVTDDGAANTITAAVSGTALDWFFKGAHDVLHNVEPGEHINNNTPAAFKDRTVTSPVPEGGVATLSGIVTDPDAGDSFTLVVNWGDGTPVHTYAFPPSSHGQRVSVSHLYRDEGNYTIALSWTDPTGPANHATLGVTVTEAAPVVQAGGDAKLKPDGVLDRTGSFTDPSSDTWTATVDYGDGTGPHTLTLHGHDFRLHHKYQHPGTYHVVVTITDDDGVTGTAAFNVTLS